MSRLIPIALSPPMVRAHREGRKAMTRRVEFLQDISEEDAMVEGVDSITGFQGLWESLHGDGAWGLNPQVWAIRYRPQEGEDLRLSLKELKK